MKKVWASLFLLQFTVVCLFACVLISLSRSPTPNDPALTSVLPVAGEKGQDAVVDYAQITEVIDQKVEAKVASSPKPKDGINGTNGTNGHTPVKGVDYFDGTPGPQGSPGIAIQKVELQTNLFTQELEWRCTGDLLWTTLATNPILTDACL